jgi:hypothetical protein
VFDDVSVRISGLVLPCLLLLGDVLPCLDPSQGFSPSEGEGAPGAFHWRGQALLLLGEVDEGHPALTGGGPVGGCVEVDIHELFDSWGHLCPEGGCAWVVQRDDQLVLPQDAHHVCSRDQPQGGAVKGGNDVQDGLHVIWFCLQSCLQSGALPYRTPWSVVLQRGGQCHVLLLKPVKACVHDAD